MLSKISCGCLVLALTLVFANSVDAEKIRTSVPGLNLNYLSIFSADAKGFFKDEGLENETIVVGGPAGIAALIGSSAISDALRVATLGGSASSLSR